MNYYYKQSIFPYYLLNFHLGNCTLFYSYFEDYFIYLNIYIF